MPKAKPKTSAKTRKKDVSASYDTFKEFKGRQYTGMAVGRTHHWYYDRSDWKEKKVTPDKWEFTYATAKRRAGRAPEGSGAAVGTGYHWFILAHQFVEKINANTYSTQMSGLKFKLAHKRAGKKAWNVSDEKQRKVLIGILKNLIADLEREPEQIAPIPIKVEKKGKTYEGTGIPILTSCDKGICRRFDVTLNKKHVGIIRHSPDSKWKISELKSQALAQAIGAQIEQAYMKKAA